MDSKLRSLNTELSGCRREIEERAKWCIKCREERRTAEATIVAATNELAKKTSAFHMAITEYIKTVNTMFISKSLKGHSHGRK
jgi:predicted enzyme involved in methoxymalonyl-ACP biosynthesis